MTSTKSRNSRVIHTLLAKQRKCGEYRAFQVFSVAGQPATNSPRPLSEGDHATRGAEEQRLKLVTKTASVYFGRDANSVPAFFCYPRL